MTDERYEELKSVVQSLIAVGVSTDKCYALEECVDKAYNADKYRWHDLRKNPTDLPKDRNRKLTIVIGKENYTRCEVLKYNDHKLPFEDNPIGWSRNNEYGYTVIAWREIEPFEEDDK